MGRFPDLLGTNLNSLQIGIGGLGKRLLRFKNNFRGDLEWEPTANRTITLPDESGTAFLKEQAIATSSGAADAGRIPNLGSNGKLSETFLNDRLVEIVNGFAGAFTGQVLTKGETGLIYTTPSGGGGGSGGGSVLQFRSAVQSSYMSITSNMPVGGSDTTISQGAELFRITITPQSASSKLIFLSQFHWNVNSSTAWVRAGIFDTAQNVSIANFGHVVPRYDPYYVYPLSLMHQVDSPGTSQKTYTIRAGAHDNTLFINGNAFGPPTPYTLLYSFFWLMEVAG